MKMCENVFGALSDSAAEKVLFLLSSHFQQKV